MNIADTLQMVVYLFYVVLIKLDYDHINHDPDGSDPNHDPNKFETYTILVDAFLVLLIFIKL